MTGHTLGAAGGVEAIATVQALHSGVLPPTRNYHDPDPELDLDYIPNEPREQQVEIALSSNFAFGGQNAAVIFRRDRKSTRLNSSHVAISYAVFCLKKKNTQHR